LQQALRCENIYPPTMGSFRLQAKGEKNNNPKTKQYVETFIQINAVNHRAQFNGANVYPGFNILTPVCALGYLLTPPYGNINAHKYAPQWDSYHKAMLSVGLLGEVLWKWNTNRPDYDPSVVRFWDWCDEVLQPEIRRATDAIGITNETTQWSSATRQKGNPNQRGIFAGCKLFQDASPQELKEDIAKGTYKSYTETLTKMCLERAVVNAPLPFFRLPTKEEREKSVGLIRMEWKEVAVIPRGDLAVALLKVGCTTKGNTAHPDFDLSRLLWLGSPEGLSERMKQCTCAELRDALAKPFVLNEDVYSQKPAAVENDEHKDAIKKYRQAHTTSSVD
jgi:anti-sigma28 factor (negative regulator of flagellin synthesis)